MIPVLQKVAELSIKYTKNGGSIINVCTGTPPDEVTALTRIVYYFKAYFYLLFKRCHA